MSDTYTVNLSTSPINIIANISTISSGITANLMETTLVGLNGAGLAIENTFTNSNHFQTVDGTSAIFQTISAASYLNLPTIPDIDNYLPLSGGNLTGSLSSNSSAVFATISASQYLGLVIPNPDLSQYLPLSGGTITGNLSSSGRISYYEAAWKGGNVTYVPLSGTLSTYVTNASAGDVLVLAAGTYNLGSSGITLTKSLTIRGQGSGATILTGSGTATVTNNSTAIRLYDIGILNSSGYSVYDSGTSGNTTLNNVSLSSVSMPTLYVGGSSPVLNLHNVQVFSASGVGIQVVTGANGILNMVDVQVNTTSSQAMWNGSATTTINALNCSFISTGYGVYNSGSGSVITLTNCYVKGSTDTFQSGTAVIIINGSVLANGTTTGTLSTQGTFYTSNLNLSSNVILTTDGANILAQRNGVNAQTYNLYNTYTSNTNYEVGNIGWTGNSFIIGTDKGSGGGIGRSLVFETGGATAMTILSSGFVGIGTTVPNVALTVIGSISATGNTYTAALSSGTIQASGLITANGGLQSGTGAGEIDIASVNNSIMGFRTVETLLSATPGATATAVGLIPSGSFIFGVTARVNTTVTGASSFNIGDGQDQNAWGTNVLAASGTTTSSNNFSITAPAFYQLTTPVVLTANGGNFTAGAVRLAVHLIQLSGPIS